MARKPTVPLHLVQEIARLWSSDGIENTHEIARRTGIDRNTVAYYVSKLKLKRTKPIREPRVKPERLDRRRRLRPGEAPLPKLASLEDDFV